MSVKTVSLATAKLLKDAGFRQDTHFVYSFDNGYKLSESRVSLFGQEVYSSPTTDELLEELPFNTRILKLNSCFEVTCSDITYHKQIIKEFLPEAIAQMWLYLKQQGLLNTKE